MRGSNSYSPSNAGEENGFLAHCKGRAVTLLVITAGVTRLSCNVIILSGGRGADMGVSHATERDKAR